MRNELATLPELSRAAACTGASALAMTGAFSSLSGAGLVGFLMLIVEEDLRSLRISNRLTGPALGLVLLSAAWMTGAHGLLTAIAGAAMVLGLLWVPFCVRVLGAGDVKALIVIGALLGPVAVPGLLVWSLLVGGLLCAFILLIDNGFSEMARRYADMLRRAFLTRRFRYLPPEKASVAASGLPFGIAIAVGVACQLTWGNPWNA